MVKQYASLVGPLLGIYYPLPFEDEGTARVALASSKLKDLWCSIYPEAEVDSQIVRWGGIKLQDSFAAMLDYNSGEILVYVTGKETRHDKSA